MDQKEFLEKEPEDYALEDIFSEEFWEGLNLDDPAETPEPELLKEEPEEEPLENGSVEEIIEEFRELPFEDVAGEEPTEAPLDKPADDPVDETANAPIASLEEYPAEEPAEEAVEVDPELEALLEASKDEPLVKIKKKRQKPTWQKTVLLYLHDLIYLMAAVIVIFLLLFRVVVVSGKSMNNTLYDGDYLLLISNVFYQNPRKGDVIVAAKDSFRDGAPIVKRIIATEGQFVDIDFEQGVVYVGDSLDSMEALEEPYIHGSTTLNEGTKFPLMVGEGKVFVMGDNRGESMDSRDPRIGLIDEREVMGKVVFLFFPGTNYNQYPREFDRIGVVE